jgi:hypothetical protein
LDERARLIKQLEQSGYRPQQPDTTTTLFRSEMLVAAGHLGSRRPVHGEVIIVGSKVWSFLDIQKHAVCAKSILVN